MAAPAMAGDENAPKVHGYGREGSADDDVGSTPLPGRRALQNLCASWVVPPCYGMSAFRNLRSGLPSGDGIGEGIPRTMWRLCPAPGLPVFVRTGIDFRRSLIGAGHAGTNKYESARTVFLAAIFRVRLPGQLSGAPTAVCRKGVRPGRDNRATYPSSRESQAQDSAQVRVVAAVTAAVTAACSDGLCLFGKELQQQ